MMSTPRRVFVEIPHSNRPQYDSPVVVSPLKNMKRKLAGDENFHSGSAIVGLVLSEDAVSRTHRASKKSKSEVALCSTSPAILTSSVDVNANDIQPPRKAQSITVSPCPFWIPIPDCFDHERVEQHSVLREFAHRFYRQLNLAKVHIDVLTAFEPLPEPTCKTMLLGLLSIIHEDESTTGSKIHSRKLADAIKRLRQAKTNLDDLWEVVQSVKDCFTMRLAQPAHKDTVDDSLIGRSTRSGPQEVIHASQLVPVLISLCEEAACTSMIRQELEDGLKEMTQFNKDRTSHVKEATEKWERLRAVFKQHQENAKKKLPHDADWNRKLRDARKQHQNALKEINVKHRTEMQSRILRFAPLGTDHDGRIYYALSHPRPIASTATRRTKSSSKKRESFLFPTLPSSAKRAEFENWAYFIFVWGRKPSEGVDLTSEMDDDVDGDTERWWGFSEPGEVRTLSKWILTVALSTDKSAEDAATPRTSLSSITTIQPTPRSVDKVRALCKGLDEFADFLEVCFGEA